MTTPSSNHIFSLGGYHLVFRGSDEFERLDSQNKQTPLVLLPIFFVMYYGAISSFFALINPNGIGLFVVMLPVFVALYLKDFLTGFHLITPTPAKPYTFSDTHMALLGVTAVVSACIYLGIKRALVPDGVLAGFALLVLGYFLWDIYRFLRA